MLTLLAMIGTFIGFCVFAILLFLGMFFSSEVGFTFVEVFNWATTDGIGGLAANLFLIVALVIAAVPQLIATCFVLGFASDRKSAVFSIPFAAVLLAIVPYILFRLWGDWVLAAGGAFLFYVVPLAFIWLTAIKTKMGALDNDKNSVDAK